MRHVAYQAALRARLSLLGVVAEAIKASTTTDIGVANGVFVRNAGSFATDRFSPGDEITGSGWPGTSAFNTRFHVKEVSALSLSVVEPITGSLAIAGGRKLDVLVPHGRKVQGTAFKPESRQPWIRETYKPISSERKSIGPRALIRDEVLWLLDIFYPINPAGTAVGTDGTDGIGGLADALLELFYPGLVLAYSGRTVTIRSSLRSGIVEEPTWVMAPVSVRFFANALTPA